MTNRESHITSSLGNGFSALSSSQFVISRPTQPEFPINKTSAPLSPIGQEDLDLLTAIIQGDEQGFMTLVDRYHSALWGFAHIFSVEKEPVEEIVMNTWQRVIHTFHLFEGHYSLKVWLFEILIHELRCHLTQTPHPVTLRERYAQFWKKAKRHSERRIPDIQRNADFPVSSYSRERWQEGIIPESLVPEGILQKLKFALYQLPLKQKQVMYLRDVEQFSSKDVVHLLQIKESQQRKLLQTAREAIRRSLDSALAVEAPGSSQKTPPFVS